LKDKPLPSAQHLLDLIREVRPQAALFTTYTFSVSYFDAVFVPVLRSVGCQDIVVLVDADQAALSTEEYRSSAAGRIYRIAPVIAPGGGVFHPKLAYLAADSDDVLAVSSGNLTASGQSLQLESFDAVSASTAPTVFRELADWFALLSELVKMPSPQASVLLGQTAPRALQAYQRNASNTPGQLPPPALVHTLDGTARETLEALFLAEADSAETVVVLSPFHAPDGGPVLRLAASVDAKWLSVGLDASRPKLVAPFEQGRFKPQLLGNFVRPEASRGQRRLHAKVFELRTKDKALVMTGSVNATAQSFESSKNVEMSLARWLPRSPFVWTVAEPLEYEVTQKNEDFQSPQSLYVDAWLDEDGLLQGRVTARSGVPVSLALTLHHRELNFFSTGIEPSTSGDFRIGPIPAFDSSQATLLTVSYESVFASCWLNVYEELEIAAEERERRAAVGRVLRGEYAAEDIAEVVRLLTTSTQAVAAGAPPSLRRPSGENDRDAEIPFSFMRWKHSGQQRGGNTLLGRTPNELLKAITRWLNRDLSETQAHQSNSGAPQGQKKLVQMLVDPAADKVDLAGIDTYQLLDQLCQVIPTALERQPGFEYAGVLAEVAASRAIDRAIRLELQMAPCLAWLDRFSRYVYPDAAQKDICAVACAMACATAHRLDAQGQDLQLATLREAVERFAGGQLTAGQWHEYASAGFGRELFRRMPVTAPDDVMALTVRMASAQTLRDGLLALLRTSFTSSRHSLTDEPGAKNFPEIAASLRARKPRKSDLLLGLVAEATLVRKSPGCPVCYCALSEQHINTLRRQYAVVHKEMNCNRILLLADPLGRMEQGIKELPDA